MKTIVLTGGGTAGHCTPNVALIPYLKKQFDNIIYIGSKNGIEKEIIEKEGIKYFAVSTAKLKRKLTCSNLLIPIEVMKGISEAKKILSDIKADVIFSKGGFVAVPVVIAGHKLKIPVISHESDFSLGLANKISLKYCDKLITTFPDTAENIKKAKYIGAPIRDSLFWGKKQYQKYGFKNDKPVLLVFGGSLGSKAINESLRESLTDILQKFNVIHICGKNNICNKLKNKQGYFQTEYLFDIENAVATASVVVSRAGSNALYELLALKKQCVVIPLPKGESRGDQEQNALYFQKKGLIAVLNQNALTPYSLAVAVSSVLENNELKQNLKNCTIQKKNSEIVNEIVGCLK